MRHPQSRQPLGRAPPPPRLRSAAGDNQPIRNAIRVPPLAASPVLILSRLRSKTRRNPTRAGRKSHQRRHLIVLCEVAILRPIKLDTTSLRRAWDRAHRSLSAGKRERRRRSSSSRASRAAIGTERPSWDLGVSICPRVKLSATRMEGWRKLSIATDRRLASLIPLAPHRPEALADEIHAMTGWASSVRPRNGLLAWIQGWQLPFWVIGMIVGALAVRLERYAALSGSSQLAGLTSTATELGLSDRQAISAT